MSLNKPVIFHEGGLGAVGHGEGVFGTLGPLNVVDAVGSIVVASDDDGAD